MKESGSFSAPSAFDVLIVILEYWREIFIVSLLGAAMGWVVWSSTPDSYSAMIIFDARGQLLETLNSTELLVARLQGGSGAVGPLNLDGVQLAASELAASRYKLAITSYNAQRSAEWVSRSIAILVPLALPAPSQRAAMERERDELNSSLQAMKTIYSSLADNILALPEETDVTLNVEGVARAMSVVRYDIEELEKKIRPLDAGLAPADQDTVVISTTPLVSARPSAARIVAGGAALGGLSALVAALSLSGARAAKRDPGTVEAWNRIKTAILHRKLLRL